MFGYCCHGHGSSVELVERIFLVRAHFEYEISCLESLLAEAIAWEAWDKMERWLDDDYGIEYGWYEVNCERYNDRLDREERERAMGVLGTVLLGLED